MIHSGDMKKQIRLMPGDKFNRLTCIKYSYTGNHYRRYFLFKCDCGNKIILQTNNVTSGNTKSCGCLSIENKTKRISRNHTEITAIILGYKRHAKNRDFEWELSRKFVEKIIKQNCFYCGSKPLNKKKTKNSISEGLYYSGIDRKDSLKNYVEDNVVPCCKICNYAKGNMELEKFKKWAIKIGKNAMAEQWG